MSSNKTLSPEEQIQQLQSKIDELSGKKRLDARGVWFCAVMQKDNDNQMAVCRAILNEHKYYKAIVILHDMDKRRPQTDAEDVEPEEVGSSDEMCAPHVHLLFRTYQKVSPRSLNKRFCNFVHFQACSDSIAYFQYMLHRDFKSSYIPTKHQYDQKDMITNCESFLAELGGGWASSHEEDIWKQWINLLRNNGFDIGAATISAIEGGNISLVRELRAHPFFYKSFFGGL